MTRPTVELKLKFKAKRNGKPIVIDVEWLRQLLRQYETTTSWFAREVQFTNAAIVLLDLIDRGKVSDARRF